MPAVSVVSHSPYRSSVGCIPFHTQQKNWKIEVYTRFNRVTILPASYLTMKTYICSYDMIAKTKLSIAENIPAPSLRIDPGSPMYKTNALTTEPKSRLSDAAVRD